MSHNAATSDMGIAFDWPTGNIEYNSFIVDLLFNPARNGVFTRRVCRADNLRSTIARIVPAAYTGCPYVHKAIRNNIRFGFFRFLLLCHMRHANIFHKSFIRLLCFTSALV
jgi:hypothetical protein